MLRNGGFAGIFAAVQHRRLFFGQQRLQQGQGRELRPGRDVLNGLAVQLAGLKPGVLHQMAAHQQFKHTVAHKGKVQRGLFTDVYLLFFH